MSQLRQLSLLQSAILAESRKKQKAYNGIYSTKIEYSSCSSLAKDHLRCSVLYLFLKHTPF